MIQGIFYNLGYGKMRDNFGDSILGKLYTGFKDKREDIAMVLCMFGFFRKTTVTGN